MYPSEKLLGMHSMPGKFLMSNIHNQICTLYYSKLIKVENH
jgi:hypothetical protein